MTTDSTRGVNDAAKPPRTIEDGFGSVWQACPHPLCDLHVCRPGKAQCSDWCDFVVGINTEAARVEAWQCDAHIAALLRHIDFLVADASQASYMCPNCDTPCLVCEPPTPAAEVTERLQRWTNPEAH